MEDATEKKIKIIRGTYAGHTCQKRDIKILRDTPVKYHFERGWGEGVVAVHLQNIDSVQTTCLETF